MCVKAHDVCGAWRMRKPKADQVYDALGIEREDDGVSAARTYQFSTIQIENPTTAQAKEQIPIQQGLDWQYIKSEII